jgi:hypothetical protein
MFGLSSIQTAIGGAVVAVIVGLGAYAYDADKAVRRETARAIKSERDLAAVTETLRREREDARARRESDARVRMLPEERVRLCAVRGPASPCCTAAGECKP